jgi:aspartyl-tRNA(Asn)/glutamyl-tRNA(Gln) amidotransferase subunit C
LLALNPRFTYAAFERGADVLRMSLDSQQLEHLARLARLNLTAEDNAQLCADLSRVVELFDRLRDAPVNELAPLAHPADLVLRLREDVVSEADDSEALLALSSAAQAGFYLVPKVIE